MKVLALTRYGREGASSRVRFLQFIPGLEAAGVDVTVLPLWGGDYLERWYRDGSRPLRDVLRRYALRANALLQHGRSADVVWMEAELFPYVPPLAERLLPRPYVVDYDDAVYEKYARKMLRPLLGSKIDQVMRGAAAVVAGNAVVADHARAVGARRVELVPTVVDPARYPAERPPDDEELRIGWIGTPHTAPYLQLVGDALRAVAGRKRLRLVVVGATPSLPGVVVETHRWSEATEAALLAGVHVGIMPLPDRPWERGKSAYKLIQYMAVGRPVIASPVGVNADVIGDAGFLATTTAEWVAALEALLDAAVRARLGAAGRRRVEERFSTNVALTALHGILLESVRQPVARPRPGTRS